MPELRAINTIDIKKVKTAAKALNAVTVKGEGDKEVNLVKEKIRVVGISNEDFIKSFISTIKSIAEEKGEELIPDDVAEVYNYLFTPPSEEETKEAEAKKEKDKAPKEKKEREPSWIIKMYDLVKAGTSEEEIAKRFAEDYKKKGVTDPEFLKKRIKVYKREADRFIKAQSTTE